MPRNRVAIQQPSGKKFWVKRHYAAHLVACGDHEVVTFKPLVIKPVASRNYKEELRFLKGRIITGISYLTIDGQQRIAGGVRAKPPRVARYGRRVRDGDTGWGDKNKRIFSK